MGSNGWATTASAPCSWMAAIVSMSENPRGTRAVRPIPSTCPPWLVISSPTTSSIDVLLLARPGDELLGDVDPVVVGEHGDIEVAREQRRVERLGRPRHAPVVAGMGVQIGATSRW